MTSWVENILNNYLNCLNILIQTMNLILRNGKLSLPKQGGKDTVLPWKVSKNERKLLTRRRSSADNSCVFLFLKAEYSFITESRAWSSSASDSELLPSKAIRDWPLCSFSEYKLLWHEDWYENEDRELLCARTFLVRLLEMVILQEL